MEGGKGACGLTSFAKTQQLNKKTCQAQTFYHLPYLKKHFVTPMSSFIYAVPHSGLMEEIQVATGPWRFCFNEEQRDPFHLCNHCLHGNGASEGLGDSSFVQVG